MKIKKRPILTIIVLMLFISLFVAALYFAQTVTTTPNVINEVLPTLLETRETNTKHFLTIRNQTMRVNRDGFVEAIEKIFVEQFKLFQANCGNSDVWRPMTSECRNITHASEISLAAIPSFMLLENYSVPSVFETIPKWEVGLEIGRVADYVIAPLLSAYYISEERIYLDRAKKIGESLLPYFKTALPFPYIGCEQGHFGKRDLFIESVSSVYPVFASLLYLTGDRIFMRPIENFLRIIRKSVHKNQIPTKYKLKDDFLGMHSTVLDIPFRLYADIARIGKILPDVAVKDLVDLIVPWLNPKNPLMVYNVTFTRIWDIDACSAAAYLDRNDIIYKTLIDKCLATTKRVPLPRRLFADFESDPFNIHPGFAFEGELLEILWQNGKVDKAKQLISKGLAYCTFNNIVTGMINVTADNQISDNFVHPEFYSRWILNSLLIAANVSYDSVVLSDGGNILKIL